MRNPQSYIIFDGLVFFEFCPQMVDMMVMVMLAMVDMLVMVAMMVMVDMMVIV